MFYSIEHLIKREGRFALVWRLATRPTTKKGVDRGQIQAVDISALCESILNHIPTSRASVDEPGTKFSLYLIGQLLYGIVVVLDKKAAYLELDARTAYDACMRLNKMNFEEIIMNPPDDQKRTVKKRKRVSDPLEAKRTIDLSNVHFDVDELRLQDYFGELDGVGQAMRWQITLADPVPDFRMADILFNEEDLQPLNEDERNELNGSSVDRRESNTDEPREHLTRVTNKTTISETDPFPQPPPNETRPPGFEFEDLHMPLLNTPLVDMFPDMTTTLLPDQENLQPAATATAEEPRVGADADDQLARQKRQADTVELLPTVDIIESPRKRRRRAIFADNEKKLPWQEVKDLVADFSSLVRPLEEVLVKKTAYVEPSVNELLSPLPTFFKAPKCLHYLFEVPPPKHKMTLAEAALINPASATYRGPPEKLWRYEESDESDTRRDTIQFPPLDEDLQLGGIAFIHDTPQKFKEAEEPDESLLNLQAKEFSTMNGGNLTLPPLPEMDLMDIQQHEIGRRSQLSGIEEARRSTFGPQSSRHENRTRSLLAPNIDMDFGFAGFKENAKVVDILSNSRAEPAKNKIAEALHMTDGGPILLQQVFPPETTSRKSAARAFAALLGMLKTQNVTTEQSEPYGDIWISGTERLTEESGMSHSLRDSTLSI